MQTLQLSLPDSHYQALQKKAKQYNQSIEEISQVILTAFLHLPKKEEADELLPPTDSIGALRRAKIHAEAQAWQKMPNAERQQYQGNFVAVHEGQVIDCDPDRLALYHRVRKKLGDVPVLITNTLSPREFRIISPRLGEKSHA
jgi:plasmid stability protein